MRDEAIIYKSNTGFVADERVAKRVDIALNSVTTKTALSERVQLKLFSWDEVFEQLDTTLTLGEFLKHTFGGLVFKKIT